MNDLAPPEKFRCINCKRVFDEEYIQGDEELCLDCFDKKSAPKSDTPIEDKLDEILNVDEIWEWLGENNNLEPYKQRILALMEDYYQNLYLGRLPEKKPRPLSGPNRNGNSEGVRKSFNKAISLMESAIRNKGAGK